MPTRAHKETLEAMLERILDCTPFVMISKRGGLTLISIDEMTIIDDHMSDKETVTYYPPLHTARVVANTEELQAIADSYVERGKSNGNT